MTDTRRSRQIALRVMLGLGAIMIVRSLIVWPQLPETMASHFDARGVPNGFQSRGLFMSIMLGVQALLGLAFGVLPSFMHRIPPSVLNLPYRDYWLTPERIGQALDRYATWSMWFGSGTFALMLGIFELAIRANLTGEPMSPMLTWLLIGGYLLATPIAIVRLYAAFKPPT